MSSKTFTLPENLNRYLVDHSVRESEAQKQLRETTAGIEHATMQISPEQGQFMALLVQLMGARRCIEVGVFTGYSALCVAQALPPEGRLIACDVSEEWTAIGKAAWAKAGVADKIDLRLAPAVETLDQLIRDGQGGAFDFAFIDADKGNYGTYYDRCLKLLRPRGLIAVDNTLWSGRVADPTNTEKDTVALRTFNAKLHRDERVMVSMVPIGDGLTLALKR